MQVVDYDDTELEKAYACCRRLLRWIGTKRGGALDLSDELELSHLKLSGNDPASIGLHDGEHVLEGITGDGAGSMTAEEEALLTEVVDRINELRHRGHRGRPHLLRGRVRAHGRDEELQAHAAVHDRATFRYAFEDKYMECCWSASTAAPPSATTSRSWTCRAGDD